LGLFFFRKTLNRVTFIYSHNNDPRAGTPLLGGKAGRAGAVQPGEEKALARSYCSLRVLKEGL